MGIFGELHTDKSDINPSSTKSFSEGAGRFMSALGKEIDEHDVVGKVGNASEFAIKAGSIARFIFLAGIVLFLLIMAITSLAGEFFLAGSKRKSILREADNKRIIFTDGVKEYQIKDSKGSWYIVDEDTYNAN